MDGNNEGELEMTDKKEQKVMKSKRGRKKRRKNRRGGVYFKHHLWDEEEPLIRTDLGGNFCEFQECFLS